jgi:hypothetical protein
MCVSLVQSGLARQSACRDCITSHVIDRLLRIAESSFRAHRKTLVRECRPIKFNPMKEFAMNAHTALIDRYFDAWNETDAGRRQKLIAATWANDAAYLDPLLSGAGHDGIDAMIRAVHERFPRHTFRRTTEVDGFSDRLRFSWELTTPEGISIVKGSDFGVVDSNGRLQNVTGFLDTAPGAA